MKKILFRFVCILSIFILIFNISIKKTVEVKAIAGIDDVALWTVVATLLGACGLTYANAKSDSSGLESWANDQIEGFESLCNANAIAHTEVIAWELKLQQGVLDTSSDVFESFKDYVSDVYSGLTATAPSEPGDFPLKGVGLSVGSVYSWNVHYTTGDKKYSFKVVENTAKVFLAAVTSSQGVKRILLCSSEPFVINDCFNDGAWSVGRTGPADVWNGSNCYNMVLKGYSDWVLDYDIDNWGYWDADVSEGSNIDTISLDDTAPSTAIDVGFEDAFTKNPSKAVSIDNVGSTAVPGATAIDITNIDAIVDAISKAICDGDVKAYTDAMTDANIMTTERTTTIDDATGEEKDETFRLPDGLPITPTLPAGTDDSIVAHLTNIFPFCLPFDLINFIDALCAEPKAPKFTIKFPMIKNNKVSSEDYVVDFSDFNDLAKILRTCESLLFIVGLILITRSHMIKS